MTAPVVVIRLPTIVTVAAPGPQGPPGTPGSGGGGDSGFGSISPPAPSGAPVVTVTSNWGIDGTGHPYYDPAGAVAAEATIAYYGESGGIVLGGVVDEGVETVNGDPGPDVVLTKTSVGLGLVDNTSDTAKPVSTTQQTALNAKAATVHTHAESDVASLVTDLAGKSPSGHAHTEADTTNLTSDLSALSTAVAGKAAASHTHTEADVTGLVSDLAVKASQSYATSRAVALAIVLGG